MRENEFRILQKKLARLTPRQQAQLVASLTGGTKQSPKMQDLIARPAKCPHCDSPELWSWGSSGGLPRFRCKKCRHTFNAVSCSPVANIRLREKWDQYLRCILGSLSLRASAKACGISLQTAFLWRHRFLALLEQHKPPPLAGIVEADETYFLESQKGSRHLSRPARHRGGRSKYRGLSHDQIPVIVARDRHKVTVDAVLPNASLEALDKALGNGVADDAVLCTDGSATLAAFAVRHGLLHEAVSATPGGRVRNGYHIQNVNAYHKRLKQWMGRFNGVSTKWLKSYLTWRRYIDQGGGQVTPRAFMDYASAA